MKFVILANEGLAIYVVYLNRYFVISPWYYLVVTFCDRLFRDGTVNSPGVPINVRIRYSTIYY